MKVFAIIFLSALAYGSPFEENNFGDFAEHDRFEDDSGSYEGIALAAPDGWETDAYNFVNELRARANLPPYEYNETVAATAQNWADRIACLKKRYHEEQENYAENIAGFHTNLDETARIKKGIQRWYDEHKLYTCAPVTKTTGDYYKSVGHYMNLMTKDNQAVGFGMTVCPEDSKIGVLVARFYNDPDLSMPMWIEQLKKQGLPEGSTDGMDNAAFVPCPSTFKVE